MKRVQGTVMLLIAVLIAASSCGCIRREVPLSPEEQAAVMEYADLITDNLLEGFASNNYTQYSRDFSDEMKESLDAAAFEENRALILAKIGNYVSRGSPAVTQSGEYVSVTYKAAFEREEGVAIRVVFREGDASHQVHGLWFNSPKLRS